MFGTTTTSRRLRDAIAFAGVGFLLGGVCVGGLLVRERQARTVGVELQATAPADPTASADTATLLTDGVLVPVLEGRAVNWDEVVATGYAQLRGLDRPAPSPGLPPSRRLLAAAPSGAASFE